MVQTATAIQKKWPLKPKLSQRAREEIVGYLCLSPWMIGFLVFTVGTMIYSLGLMFYKTDMLTPAKFVGWGNFVALVKDPFLKKSIVVTTVYTLGSVPLGLVLSLAVALMLNQKIPGQGVYRTIYYLPSVVSGVAVAVLWAWMFHPDWGLINSGLALLGIKGPRWLYSEEWALPAFIIMSVWGVGGNMLLYLAGLQGIPTPMYEAAKIDGANAWHRFRYVTIPMLTPTIFFNLVRSIIGSFQVFTQSYVMTQGGPNNATLTYVLYIYRKGFEQFYFGYASVLAWVLFCIILLFTLLVFRSSELWVYYEGELKK